MLRNRLLPKNIPKILAIGRRRMSETTGMTRMQGEEILYQCVFRNDKLWRRRRQMVTPRDHFGMGIFSHHDILLDAHHHHQSMKNTRVHQDRVLLDKVVRRGEVKLV
jgi:hypothetical protein